MANVVRDPKEHPDTILPDLSKPDPLVTFSKDELPSSIEANRNSAISRKSVMTIRSARPMGRNDQSGGPISSRREPSRRHRFIRRTT